MVEEVKQTESEKWFLVVGTGVMFAVVGIFILLAKFSGVNPEPMGNPLAILGTTLFFNYIGGLIALIFGTWAIRHGFSLRQE